MKKRAYEQGIREVEHDSFTPIVLLATGEMANEATNFCKRMASNLATKWVQQYSSTMSWLCCMITFSLLRSAIQGLRGTCSSAGHAQRFIHPMDLVTSESEISNDYYLASNVITMTTCYVASNVITVTTSYVASNVITMTTSYVAMLLQ